MSEFWDALEKGKHQREIIGSNIIPEESELEKAKKFLRRLGSPGHYEYIYKEKKGKQVKSSVSESHYKNGVSTESLYKNVVDGKVVWDKDRVKDVHTPIIESYLSKAKISENPTVYLMMGAPGSGKGAVLDYLKEKGHLKKDLVVVDPDDIKTKKEHLGQDYEEYWKHHKDKASGLVHEEGSHLSNKIIKDLRKLKSELIIDKTFTDYGSLTRTVSKFRHNGYSVKVIMAFQTSEIGHQNIKERFERTGRGVNPDYSKKSYENIGPTSLKFVKHLPDGVSFEQWHAKKYGEAPSRLYTKSGDKESGSMKV